MKKIWIFNHYATNTFFDHAGRHYYFAKYLRQSGYDVTIFCASTVHNSDKNLISDDTPYYVDTCDEIPYVFIKARNYKGNGKQRILNMLDYYRGLFRATKALEKPDVIIGSSVHPLACLAALRLSKKYKCRNIVEIRDLWPESLFAFDIMKKETLFGKLLYAGERWLYHKADRLIFTMAGGKDYIREKGWEKDVPLDKVFYINNGVDLETYAANRENFEWQDPDLDDPAVFKVVYAGTIRKANSLQVLVQCAALLQDKPIRILLFGEGEDLEELKRLVQSCGLQNVFFKGKVDKKYIPSILSKSDLNILNYHQASTWKYGGSQNKLFEYLASGKPVLANVEINYSPILQFDCGISKNLFTPQEYADAIESIAALDATAYHRLCENARQAAAEFDFKRMTPKLLEIINRTRDPSI